MVKCPHTGSPEWRKLVDELGEQVAWKVFIAEDGTPNMQRVDEIIATYPVSSTKYTFKAINILMSERGQRWMRANKGVFKQNKEQYWKKLQADLQIPKAQVELLKEIDSNDPSELIVEFAAKYGFEVQVETATTKALNPNDPDNYYELGATPPDEREALINSSRDVNTRVYESLTVPGGTNYTENEIAIPDILVEEPSNVPIKKGVDFVFEQNPELANIGTQQLYSQYLDTIFPDSKVKDIVYHGSNQKIEQFEVRKEPLIHFGTKSAALQRGNVLNQTILNIKDLQTIKDGMWFLGTDEGGLLKELLDRNILTIEEVKSINEVKHKAIQQSPYFHENYRMAIPAGEKAGNQKLQEILKNKNIGFEYVNESEDKGSVSYAVPSQEQIHILGSKQDIEGFKKWKKNNPTQKIKKGIIPSIKGHAQFATDNGIGWFRSDDEQTKTITVNSYEEQDYYDNNPNYNKLLGTSKPSYKEKPKTRRILEVQSDLYQKSRDIKSAEDIYAEMKKSGELSVDCG